MKKKVSRFFVTIVMVLCLSTATFAETKAMTGSNLETSSLQFETVYTDIWEYVKEYREVSMYAENLVYVVLRRKGKTNYETDTFHEWNYDELFERLFESGEEYDFILVGRICGEEVEETEHLYELEPLFTVVDNIVPPNAKKLGVMRNLIYNIQENKKPIYFRLKKLTPEEVLYVEGDKQLFLVEAAIGSIEPENSIARK